MQLKISHNEIQIPLTAIEVDPKLNARALRNFSAPKSDSAGTDEPQDGFGNVCTSLGQLEKSMKDLGQLQAILVSPGKKEGTYKLIGGFRRYNAAKMLGWETIRSTVIESNKVADWYLANLAENVGRRDLTAPEIAEGIARLIGQNLKGGQIASKIGMSNASVSRYKDIMEKVHPSILEAWKVAKPGTIPVNWLREISALPHADQLKVFKELQATGTVPKIGEKDKNGDASRGAQTPDGALKRRSQKTIEDTHADVKSGKYDEMGSDWVEGVVVALEWVLQGRDALVEAKVPLQHQAAQAKA